MEFKINDNEIFFRKRCSCNKKTCWIKLIYFESKDKLFSKKYSHIKNDIFEYIIQCKKCNPSNSLIEYVYGKENKHRLWTIKNIKYKCNLCNNYLQCSLKSNNQTNYFVKQCQECFPKNDYIKFEYDYYNNYGCKIKKIKKLNKTQHNWFNYTSDIEKELKKIYNLSIIDENYTCPCEKCSS